ncbi:hypothetical protein JCM4814A_03540 [Streptomyces phaeofaciens JCM 4814]|uniref:Uncharacterized protein n=1 Tax=Streptomyces phaeofaciens TaxID=68254 RepID=A0A918HSI4_9ACTN|nr:hypothetical protein GCM10010226_88770 [Streptomyces phaeofaciens]
MGGALSMAPPLPNRSYCLTVSSTALNSVTKEVGRRLRTITKQSHRPMRCPATLRAIATIPRLTRVPTRRHRIL